MAYTSTAAVAVTDTPAVVILASAAGRRDVLVGNAGPNAVYVGSASVTAATGVPFEVGQTLTYTQASTGGDDAMYAICASGQTASLRVVHGPVA